MTPISSITLEVPDPGVATTFYSEAFGLNGHTQGDRQVVLGLRRRRASPRRHDLESGHVVEEEHWSGHSDDR